MHGRRRPPSTLSRGRPLYFLASITKTPVGVTARWSMFAVVPGFGDHEGYPQLWITR